MNAETVREFLGCCAIINGGVLVLTALILAFAGGFVYRVHSRLFPMPRETFNALIYGFLGVYKILFITLNLVPYLALVIIR